MKKRTGTILIVLVFLIGLGVLLYPTLSDIYQRYEYSEIIKQYEEDKSRIPEKDYQAMWEAAEAYNRDLTQKTNQFAMSDVELERIATLLNPHGTGMMGYIDIDKINVHLPIFQGTEEKQLQSGAGWWIGSSIITGGESTHSIVTAHTGLVKAKMFTDIDQLAIGDTFTVHILDRIMTYEVDQILICEPYDVRSLLIEDGEDYLTLYSCYPYGVNTQRILVRGNRVGTTVVETEPREVQEFIFTLLWWEIAVLAFLVILLLAAFIAFVVWVCKKLIKRRRNRISG